MDKKLREYAKLLVEVGLNVQPGQTLVLSSPVECAYFARLCASAAYDAGCREVVMNWGDDYLAREKYLRADVNKDGEINVQDAAAIIAHILA